MGRLCAVILVVGWAAGTTRADAPVKIAAVPDGPIKLAVSEDAGELRRSFRLVPQAVEQVKIDQVRVLDCTDARGLSCPARVEPGGCAGGCTLTGTESGAVSVVVTLPAPGTYTSSLEIVYVKDEKARPDNSPQIVKAVLATTLEVTRPAPAIQPMRVTIAGPTGVDVELGLLRTERATLFVRAQDEDGAARKLAQVVAGPLVRRSGNDALATSTDVKVYVSDQRAALASGAPLELPPGGVILTVQISGLDEPGKFEGKLRLLATGRTPQEITYTVTVRESVCWPILMIGIGATLSYGVKWWVGKRRRRLVQQKLLERQRERVRDLEQRSVLGDRDRRLLDALVGELDDQLDVLENGDALEPDALERFAKRVALAGTLINTGQDIEKLPLAARPEPRKQLDAHALALANRALDDARLKDVETTLGTIASTGVRRDALTALRSELEVAVKRARGALSTALQQRLADEIDPFLREARIAAGRDRLNDLDLALANGRRALAKVQGAAVAERLAAMPPELFDGAAYRALSDDVSARLAALDVTTDADTAAQLYEDLLSRLASTSCEATARWCLRQVAGQPAAVQNELRKLAAEAEAARGKPAAEALEIVERVQRDALSLADGPKPIPTGAGDDANTLPSALTAIPSQAAAVARPPRVRTRTLIVVGDGAVLFAVWLIAVATGIKLLWVGSPNWGGWNDWLTAVLWGAGLHAIGNESFKGLLGLQKDLGKVE